MTDDLPDREPDLPSAFLAVPGVRNFRDAGGVGTLRTGVLYRSGSFHTLAPEGAQRLKALGLRLVIDLRSPFELEVWPDLRHGLDHEAVNLPTLPANRENTDRPWPEGQAELYPFMAETAGPSLVAAIRRLGTPGGVPAVVHCAVGKDRTGLTIAVVQSLLGASDAEITADFLLSNAGLGLLDGPTPTSTRPAPSASPAPSPRRSSPPPSPGSAPTTAPSPPTSRPTAPPKPTSPPSAPTSPPDAGAGTGTGTPGAGPGHRTPDRRCPGGGPGRHSCRSRRHHWVGESVSSRCSTGLPGVVAVRGLPLMKLVRV